MRLKSWLRLRFIALSGNDALSCNHVTGLRLGLAPYEMSITELLGLTHPRGGRFAPSKERINELLKVAKDKPALKVAKRKLGAHTCMPSEKERRWPSCCRRCVPTVVVRKKMIEHLIWGTCGLSSQLNIMCLWCRRCATIGLWALQLVALVVCCKAIKNFYHFTHNS